MEWNELKEYVLKRGVIKRSEYNENLYKIYKQELCLKEKTIDEFIMKEYLTHSHYAFTINKFPYDFKNNIKHYILWFRPKYYSDNILNIDAEIKRILNFFIINKIGSEYLYMMNKIENQSILNIPHYQVFIKI